MFNFKYIKEKASPGSWRRGYEYHQKKQVIEAILDENIINGKVKGRFQDHYKTNLFLDNDQVKAECDCPLEEEWCKHAVAVGIYSIEKHVYDKYLDVSTSKEIDYSDESPAINENPQGTYRFIFNSNAKPNFASIQIIERTSGEVITNIATLLKQVLELQKIADAAFELNEAQKRELYLIQELYKVSKFDSKSKYFHFPFSMLDKFFKLFYSVEEVIDSKNKKRLEFKNQLWKLVLSVNVSLVGNVLLSLHWHRPEPENVYPFEEIRYFSRSLKWARYKNVIFQTDTPLSVIPHFLTKSTFTDIRDADGGKFVYEELPKIKELMTVEISETLEKLILEQKPPFNVLILSLEEEKSVKATLEFEYDGIRVAYGKLAEKTPYVTIKKPKEDIIYWIKRNLAYEEEAYKMLLASKFTPMQTNNLHLDPDSAIDFYNFYRDKAGPNWIIEEKTDLSSLKVAKDKLTIYADIDFGESTSNFEVEIYCTVGKNKIDYETVESYMHQGLTYISMEGIGNVEVPHTKIVLFNRSLSSFDAVKTEENKFSVKTFRAGLIVDLREQGIELKMSRKFKKFWTQISTFNISEDVEVPKKVNATLREYQHKGLNWLWFLYSYGLNGVLADDMGLGKTLQTLALIQKSKDKEGKKPNLVICPTSVVFNWEAEIEKFTPNLSVLNLTGAERYDSFKNIEKTDIIITSYALVRRDINLLKKYDFRSVILDESQNIKNYESQTAQATKQLNCDHRFALSGTPVENRLSELWSLFDFLMPEFLYDINEFNYKFVTPIMEREDKTVGARLKKQIYPFILRRMKRDVAKDLPDKIENIAYCKMTPAQDDYYTEFLMNTRETLLKEIERNGMEKSKMSIFAALLRLRQICCHPKLADKEGQYNIEESGKFEHLKEMLEDIVSEGHRVLIFSQFVQMLDIVKEWLEKQNIKYEYLTGATKDRKTKVDNFNNDDSIPIFLLSLKAGGTGLNLTGADYVIHYDPWWNPAVEDQATDRAYRIGQTKKVFVYRLITKGTVEEKIQKLKSKKRDLVDSIISVDKEIGKTLTYEDIKDILSPD
jgi:superfamily II DNA or RNA helicase